MSITTPLPIKTASSSNKTHSRIMVIYGTGFALTDSYLFINRLNRSLYSTAELRVPELIPVLGSQPAGDVSHKPGGRLPLLSARPAVTLATLKTATTSFAVW